MEERTDMTKQQGNRGKEIDAEAIGRYILERGRNVPELHIYDCIGSTNSEALALGNNVTQDVFFVAAKQDAGRGRIGRSFCSPEGGLYMSVLTRAPGESFLRVSPAWAGFITAGAGIALTGAIRSVFGLETGLKWVNDLIFNGAKAGGILTESLFSGSIPVCTVTGAGVNIWPPAAGFPPELTGKVSTLLSAPAPMAREKLAAAFYTALRELLDALEKEPEAAKKMIYEKYRSSLCMLGLPVEIRRGTDRFGNGSGGRYAIAEDLTEDLCLRVRFPDESTEELSSAEVSVKIDFKASESPFSADLRGL